MGRVSDCPALIRIHELTVGALVWSYTLLRSGYEGLPDTGITAETTAETRSKIPFVLLSMENSEPVVPMVTL